MVLKCYVLVGLLTKVNMATGDEMLTTNSFATTYEEL